MYRITFALDALGDPDLALCDLAILLEALTQANALYLQAHPEVLPSDRLGLVHMAEPQGPKNPGNVDWQDVPTLLRPKASGQRTASNADLACLRAAELRVRQGIRASPRLLVQRRPNGQLFYDVGLEEWGQGVKGSGGQGLSLPSSRHPVTPSPRFLHTRQRVAFVLGLFDGDRERPLSNAILQVLLDALTDIDVLFLERHPETPDIYASRVRYVEEPPMQEDWQDIATCLRMGVADCDDWGPWFAAQRRVRQGIHARARWTSQKRKGGGMLYHIISEDPDGHREDPSKVQGMR